MQFLKILILAVMTVSGCEKTKPQNENLEITFDLSEDKPSLGSSVLQLTVKDAQSGSLVEKAKIEVEGNMTHPGMAPVFAKVKELGNGKYKVEMDFNMAGDWIISANAHSKDGRQGDKTFNLRL